VGVALWPPPVSHLPAGGNGSLVAPRGVRAPYRRSETRAMPAAGGWHSRRGLTGYGVSFLSHGTRALYVGGTGTPRRGRARRRIFSD